MIEGRPQGVGKSPRLAKKPGVASLFRARSEVAEVLVKHSLEASLQLGGHLLGDALGAARALLFNGMPPPVEVRLGGGGPRKHGERVDQILKALGEQDPYGMIPLNGLDQGGNFPPEDYPVAGH
jgi:hypothetical protein